MFELLKELTVNSLYLVKMFDENNKLVIFSLMRVIRNREQTPINVYELTLLKNYIEPRMPIQKYWNVNINNWHPTFWYKVNNIKEANEIACLFLI